MKYLKKALIITITAVLLLTSGCNDRTRGETLVDDLYQKHNREINRHEISDDIIDEILAAAEDKDYGRIEVLFSDYALENNDNLEEEFYEFCDYCSFDIDEVSGHTDYSSKSAYSGHYLLYYLGYEFTVKGEDTTYILNVIWIADNVEDESQIGIQSVELFKEEYAGADKIWGWGTNVGFHLLYE